MPQLWTKIKSRGDGKGSGWIMASLKSDLIELLDDQGNDPPLLRLKGVGSIKGRAILVKAGGGDHGQYVLICGLDKDVSVNGTKLFTGIKTLNHQDEILLLQTARRFYYSTERLPTSEIFPGEEGRSLICPRCRQEIKPGDQVVRCPQCGIYHHQYEELPCWNYCEKCSICDQDTRRADYGFHPMQLHDGGA